MSGLKPVLEKSSENIDGQNTIRAINIAKTVDDRVREYEIAQEEEKLKGKKPEPSLQEILYGVMKDMGQEPETQPKREENEVQTNNVEGKEQPIQPGEPLEKEKEDEGLER